MPRLTDYTKKRLRQKNPGAFLNNPYKRRECSTCDAWKQGYDAGYLAGLRAARK